MSEGRVMELFISLVVLGILVWLFGSILTGAFRRDL
jgi:hypothetical protein